MAEFDLYFAGIDLGSTMTKVVIIDQAQQICGSVIRHSGAEHRRLANQVMEEALMLAGMTLDRIGCVVATGYGRMSVPFADHQVTELNCHARGVAHLFPAVRLAIDIGGQDAKVLKIENGRLTAFIMSDKCAAGTGRFLEVIADTLGLALDDLAELSSRSTRKVAISSVCTVFARQEVVAALSEGKAPADIVAGIHDAIAGRTARMACRFEISPDVVFTGGVAKNKGVVQALDTHLGRQVLVPDNPLISGALGAALIGRQMMADAAAQGEPLRSGQRRLDEARFFG